MSETLKIFLIILVYLGVFLVGELVRRIWPEKPEFARKTVHFLGGLAALPFPYIFSSQWTVLGLTLGFVLLILWSKKYSRLMAVHGVSRQSFGAIYFPLAIYLVFLLGQNRPVLYVISILVMTFSDSFAALLGGKYGSLKYEVEDNIKSLEGSTVFFFLTFLCVHLPLLLMTGLGRLECILIALIIALLATGFEAISLSGFDNLLVPLGTYYLLAKLVNLNPAALGRQVLLLLVMTLATILISRWGKIFKTSGLIGMTILNYASWSLGGFYWFLPLLMGQMIYACLILIFIHYRGKSELVSFQIKTLFYTALLPTLLIFASNTLNSPEWFYRPYLVSLAAQIAIISDFFWGIIIAQNRDFKFTPGPKSLIPILALSFPLGLIVAFPAFLNQTWGSGKLFWLVAVPATVLSYFLFILIFGHSIPPKPDQPREHKIRLACVLVGLASAFILQILFKVA